MRRLTIAIAVGAALAASAANAQFQRGITQQEYYKLSVTYAADEAIIRSVVDYLGGVSGENEAILIAFYQELLTDRGYADYMHARYGSRFDPNAPPEDALATGLLQGTEVVLDGMFRLSVARQEQYLAFARFGLEQVIATSPGICRDLAAADANAIDYAAVDFTAFDAMSPAELENLLGLYREAITAEIEDRPAVVVFDDDQRAAGQQALGDVTLDLIEASPLGARLVDVEVVDDLTAEEICDLTLIVFDALDQLEQPERGWAIEAVIGRAL